jgi:hypothetical protein
MVRHLKFGKVGGWGSIYSRGERARIRAIAQGTRRKRSMQQRACVGRILECTWWIGTVQLAIDTAVS